ncbi:Nicotinamidase-related amidase [Noviherbaspirillum humi]|uniref:Nicotinamidase-related amidase n=1 Tax=Noviherbaspirillum humi TaxID=1688639 RepID=A0A239IL21_9BURK|nr:isochorismatase family protein [Noviherbaspirillum humi]SNS94466.1 Nicotinamidase-related amidase [Noviherbaspirillum humi]
MLNADRTALLLFDFLEGHVERDAATRSRYSPVIAAAARLLHAARSRGMMVAHACASHRPDNATSAHTLRDMDFGGRRRDPAEAPTFRPAVAGGDGSRIVAALAPQPEDYLIPKYRWSAFFQTYLDLALRTRGVDTLILCGGSTEIGIASTAYAARDLDYNLVLARDACTSPSTATHEHLMDHVFPRLAWVRRTEEILRLLGE